MSAGDEATLRRNRRAAAVLLLRAMFELAEHFWVMREFTGLDTALWQEVLALDPRWPPYPDLLRWSERRELCFLAEQAGGWWTWPSGSVGADIRDRSKRVRLIALEDWRQWYHMTRLGQWKHPLPATPTALRAYWRVALRKLEDDRAEEPDEPYWRTQAQELSALNEKLATLKDETREPC